MAIKILNDLDMDNNDILNFTGGGGGAVDSVNGET